MINRRTFLKYTGATTLTLFATGPGGLRRAIAESLPGGTLDPSYITKFITPLLVPPAMPRAGKTVTKAGKNVDYYEIAVRQFTQQVLPVGLPGTTLWGYGPNPGVTRGGPLIFNAPSLTIEAKYNTPVRIKWINELVDDQGNFLSHLLPVDPTLHWANPPGGEVGRDTRPSFASTPGPYTGPVPLVTHVHGAVGVGDESDGYAEAWFLPVASNIPGNYATEGTWYEFFAGKARDKFGVEWGPGYATFQYPNAQRAATLWYHDHTLGMTRLNVYAGPAGFFIVRGGPDGDGAVRDSRTGRAAVLPGPAPAIGDLPGQRYYEIPLAIQDRSFNDDGSLFYPDTREFFDGIVGPFVGGDHASAGHDGGHEHAAFSPIWNPEYFGNTIIVNGNTWPFHTVEKRRYRLRFLNGCQSRFLILDFADIPGVKVWQIGNEGGFLATPVDITSGHGNRLLMGLAERADVIVDFTDVPLGDYVLGNLGPDEPFGGGTPSVDFPVADPETTGRIMQFRVVRATGPDPTTPPARLVLPAIRSLPQEDRTRPLALIEKMGMGYDAAGTMVVGPTEAVLGRLVDSAPVADAWIDAVTENPAVGATEVWEFYNTTGDAHPMHVHEVVFQVVNREGLVLDADEEVATPIQLDGIVTPPEPWETGFKDTVIAYPGQVTRIRATFRNAGQYVWHCHIVEHEDNEMMRPYRIGPEQAGQPMPRGPHGGHMARAPGRTAGDDDDGGQVA